METDVSQSQVNNNDTKTDGGVHMSISRRFVLDADRHVVDMLNPENPGKGEHYSDAPEDERSLRNRLLSERLSGLVNGLIINAQPMKPDSRGDQCEPREVRFSIWWALFCAISASHLNSLDPILSIQNRFGGKLDRIKEGLADFTSLSMFADDVERLLRDLYGESDQGALDQTRRAVLVIVEEFTRLSRKDLWEEHQNALIADRRWGIGLPAGYSISSSQIGQAEQAEAELAARGRLVLADPSSFSKYTVEFFTQVNCDLQRVHVSRLLTMLHENFEDGRLDELVTALAAYRTSRERHDSGARGD